MSCITMVTGALSNLMALVIVGRARAGKRLRGTRARPYLQLASALLLHDLGAHLIPGALAMKLHARQRRGLGIGPAAGGPLCQLFGACMVYFGLSPLLLGGAMAMERCLGISRPLLHARVATPGHARAAVLMLCGLALLLALVPVLDGTGGVRYVPQFPGTWCFLPLHANGTRGSTGLGLLFSSLGLAALGLSLLCNTLSGAALLQRRLGTSRGGGDGGGGRRRAGWSSGSATSSLSESSRSRTSRWLDIEMMSQLAAITVVSCLCWSPFLIIIMTSLLRLHRGSGHEEGGAERLVLLGLRLASWNQVLDPWVYILLRRAVLKRAGRILHLQHSNPRRTPEATDRSVKPGAERRATEI